MPGASRTNLEGFYGELDGLMAVSQWAEDIMASADDKLHMTETSLVQTVQGPISWSNTSMMTFAGPLNMTNTGISTFAGQLTATNTGVHTWAGPFNSTTTGTNTWAGPMDFNNTVDFAGIATFTTHVYFAGGTDYWINNLGSATLNAGTFGGIVTFNTHAYYASGTTYYISNTAYAYFAELSADDIKFSSAKTRYKSFILPDRATGALTFNTDEHYWQLNFGEGGTYYVNLPDGCTVKKIHVVTAEGGDDDDIAIDWLEYTMPDTYVSKLNINDILNIADAKTKYTLDFTDFTYDGTAVNYIRLMSYDTLKVYGLTIEYDISDI